MARHNIYRICAYTFNTITFITLIVLFILFEGIMSPFNRGFFCNDESIQKPYVAKQTVPVAMLTGLAVGVVLIVVIGCDIYSHFHLQRRYGSTNVESDHMVIVGGIRMNTWIYRTIFRLFLALIGGLMCLIVTGIGKVMVGRLRPHFLAVCKPDYSKFNCSAGYITFDVCTGTDERALRQARLSFPSGHSSCSAYTVVFVALYIQYVFITKGFSLLKPFVQLSLVCLGVACGLTRISDYFHHWSDVLAGFLLGTLFAVYTVYGLLKLPAEEEELREINATHTRDDVESQLTSISVNVPTNYRSVNAEKGD